MLMAGVGEMVVTALLAPVAMEGMVETVLPVVEVMAARGVTASRVKVGTVAMEVTVPLEVAEVVPALMLLWGQTAARMRRVVLAVILMPVV